MAKIVSPLTLTLEVDKGAQVGAVARSIWNVALAIHWAAVVACEFNGVTLSCNDTDDIPDTIEARYWRAKGYPG